MYTLQQRVKKSAILAAVGDALGAGIEFWTLEEILKVYSGSDRIEYTRATPGRTLPVYTATGKAGDVTDDTATTMCIMAALTKTMDQFKTYNKPSSAEHLELFQHAALKNIFQSLRYWGQFQNLGTEETGQAFDLSVADTEWPTLTAFKEVTGMGFGVLKILRYGTMGTLENLPVIPSQNPSATPVYSKGCGALMRVMPIGLFCSQVPEIDAFNFGCRSGAITHGDATSYLSAGLMAELIVDITKTGSAAKSVTQVKERLVKRMNLEANDDVVKGYANCLKAIDIACDHLQEDGAYAVDATEKVGLELAPVHELFTTTPVLAQALFVILAAEKHGWTADISLRIAATHSGDSDSVATIVGYIIALLPNKNSELSEQLSDGLSTEHYQAIMTNCEQFSAALIQFKQKKPSHNHGFFNEVKENSASNEHSVSHAATC